jgi:hypothetical protein
MAVPVEVAGSKCPEANERSLAFALGRLVDLELPSFVKTTLDQRPEQQRYQLTKARYPYSFE